MSTEDSQATGLYAKYDVIDRRTGKLVTDPVFVLNPQTDAMALVALYMYTGLASYDGHFELAADLARWTLSIRAGNLPPDSRTVAAWAFASPEKQLRLAKAALKARNECPEMSMEEFNRVVQALLNEGEMNEGS